MTPVYWNIWPQCTESDGPAHCSVELYNMFSSKTVNLVHQTSSATTVNKISQGCLNSIRVQGLGFRVQCVGAPLLTLTASNPNPKTQTSNPNPKTQTSNPNLKTQTSNPNPKTQTSNPNLKTQTSNPKPKARNLKLGFRVQGLGFKPEIMTPVY